MSEERAPEHQADHVEFCYDGKFMERTTALPASFLDSQTKFETTIRKTFGPGLFNVAGDIKVADLSEYLRYLKHDYVVHCMERSCQNAPFTGFYDPDYWVLSETQQIKNGRLLREDEREYVIIHNNAKAMSVAINKNLISSFSNFLERADADGYGIDPDTALKKNNVGKSKCLENQESVNPTIIATQCSFLEEIQCKKCHNFQTNPRISVLQSSEFRVKQTMLATWDELPNTMQRWWTSGMSSTLVTYCMLAVSAGKEIGLGEVVKSIVFQRTATKNDNTFFEELQAKASFEMGRIVKTKRKGFHGRRPAEINSESSDVSPTALANSPSVSGVEPTRPSSSKTPDVTKNSNLAEIRNLSAEKLKNSLFVQQESTAHCTRNMLKSLGLAKLANEEKADGVKIQDFSLLAQALSEVTF
eukprot:gene19664-21611_t